VRINRAEILDHGLVRQLADGAGQLHAGGTAADDDERHQLLALFRVLSDFSELESLEDAVPDVDGMLNRLQARRERPPVVMAEVTVLDAGGNDEHVVAQLAVLVHQDFSRRVQIQRGRLDRAHVGYLRSTTRCGMAMSPGGSEPVATW